MKRKLLLLFLILILAFTFAGCGHTPSRDPLPSDNIVATPLPSDTQSENTSRFLVDTSLLTLDSTRENVNGDIIDIYTDGTYLYWIFRDTNEFSQLSLSPEAMESLEDKYAGAPDEIISQEAAEDCMLEAVKYYFPEYDDNNLKITVEETGNLFEYYAFGIAEYDGVNRVNYASISIAFDGTVGFVTGSHNSPELFDGSDIFSEDEILDIVFNYVLEENENISNEIYPAEEYYENGEVMPEYQLLIATKDDLIDFTLEKIVYNNRPCWQAEFTLISSWSQIDEFFEVTNPIFHVYVDAVSGEVLSYIHT